MKGYRVSLLAVNITFVALFNLGGCLQPATQDDLGSTEQPITTSGLHLWLRADTGVLRSDGLSASNGQQVARWLDQSGNGRNASMATSARQPSLAAGALNGLPVLRFNGAQSMYLDIFARPTRYTVFIVGKNSTPTETFSMILGPGGNSANNQMRWEGGSNALFVGPGNGGPVNTSTIGNTRIYHELSASYDGATMTVYRDGNAVSPSYALSTTAPWELASVGSYYSSYYMTGDLAEVIMYDRALSASERGSVDSYLRTKYFTTCGDGICSGSENSSTCPSDCDWCGNGICGGNENSWTCPSDCAVCGDGICNGSEDSWTCPSDCAFCGNGVCDSNENSWTCPGDCGSSCLPPCAIE